MSIAERSTGRCPPSSPPRRPSRARVTGVDADKFARIVGEAADLCPVSRLFASAKISVKAELE